MTETPRNPLGVHALVWAGGTDPESMRHAVDSSKQAGYDLLEISLHDTESLDVAGTRAAAGRAGLGLVCSRGLGFDADVSSPDPEVSARGEALLADSVRIARDLGADIALVITPYYARPTQDALFAWYSTVAAEYPDLPIVVYNVPSRTAVSVEPSTVARLRKAHDNIVGIKETTKDFEHFSHVLHLAGQDFLMWSGIELLCLPLLAIGGVGFVSAVANLAPGAVARMYESYVDGRTEEAIDLHYRLHPLVELVFVETNPAPIKAVLAERGLIASGHVRPPLLPLTDQGRTKAAALLDAAGDLVPGA